MAKSKAKKAAKRNKQRDSKPKEVVEAVEAKTIIDEEVEDEDVELAEDEEEVEEVDEDTVEDIVNEDSDEDEDEDSEDEEEEEEEDDDDESEDDDDEDDDEDEDSEDDEEDEDEDSEDDDESEDDDDEDDDEDEEVVKPVAKTKKKVEKKASKKASKKEVKASKSKVTVISTPKDSKIKKFFSRKCDKNENILTIFKDTKIIAAILGEIVGTALVTGIALTLGLTNPLYMILAYVGITVAVFKLSGAHLNPTITAGMMASRRVSAIRGCLYIIAQLIGAWLAILLVRAFYNAGIKSGNIDASYVTLPVLTGAADTTAATEGFSFFASFAMVEFVGAIIISFFFARAQEYKQKAHTFALIAATGLFLALLFAVVINSNFFALSTNSFVLNPAIGFVYGIFPSNAESFDALMNALMPMLAVYVLFPVLGGIIGFFANDFMKLLNGENFEEEE